MLLGTVFERFAAKSPVSVMVQATLERALTASQLDSFFEAHATGQYTRELLFSTGVDLLSQIACGVNKSVQAAEEPIPVSLTSVYNKLNGIEPPVAAELVRHCANQLGPVVGQLGGVPCHPGSRATRFASSTATTSLPPSVISEGRRSRR